jgi:RNA methyltransferase, TrmH family
MAGDARTGQGPGDIESTLALIQRLHRDRHARDTHGLFYGEGIRNLTSAVEHGYPIDTVVYSERLLIAPVARALVRRLKREGVPYARLSPEQFRAISHTERASGVGVILRQRIRRLEDLIPGEKPCWVAVEHVRSPGNFGSLMRTSAAVGGGGFILLGKSIDPYDPAVVRPSMGAFFRQTLARASIAELNTWVARHHLSVVAASPDGATDFHRAHYARPVVLMLGEERRGLTHEQRVIAHQIVRIPMAEGIDSLNLAVAGSLLMYEALRSRDGS